MRKINWVNVLEQAIGAVIASVVIALAVYLYNVISGQAQASSWLWVGLVVLAVSIVIAFAWRTFRRLLSWLGRWVIGNWQLVISLVLLLGIAYGDFALTGSLWSMVLTLGLALTVVFLARSLHLTPQVAEYSRIFQMVPLPIGKVANASLEGKYRNPPLGEVFFDGVRFLLKSGAYVFDTSTARYIDPDGRVRVKVELSEPVERVKSVHLLINAGGAWRVHPDSQKPFEWLKIGEIELGFQDGAVQRTELILGDNVREWAIGNFPGKLVDRVVDPLCQVAWRGKNTEGNYAVIDRLEIPILESNKSRTLEFVGLIREIRWHMPPEEGGLLHFFVSAITLELEQ